MEQWEDLDWATDVLAGVWEDNPLIAEHICRAIAVNGASDKLRQAASQALAGVSGSLN
jgi:hypothetical protein